MIRNSWVIKTCKVSNNIIIKLIKIFKICNQQKSVRLTLIIDLVYFPPFFCIIIVILLFDVGFQASSQIRNVLPINNNVEGSILSSLLK